MNPSRLTVQIDPKNSYRNLLLLDDEIVLDGNSGLLSVEVIPEGKRMVVRLTIAGLTISVADCPERNRYRKIEDARGNIEALGKLQVSCELLKISPFACDHCPKKPIL